MTPFRPSALALHLALALAARPGMAGEPSPPEKAPETAPATGEEKPPPEPSPSGAPPSEKPAPSSTPAPGEKPGSDNWVDVSHRFVEQRLFAPILRVDRFFSDEREIEAEREQSFLRWRSEVAFSQDATRPAFRTGLNANLRLPGLNQRLRRLRLVIEGETRDTVSALFPRQPTPGAPSEVATDEEAAGGRGDAGVRYALGRFLDSHVDLGGGFLLRVPPGVFGRLRLRWAFPVGPLFLTRTALIGFWRSDVKFGATATLQLDRPVKRWFLLRASGSGTRSERSNGLEWATELAAIVPLPPRSAAQVGIGWAGATAASTFATEPATGIYREFQIPILARTRVYSRLRSDLYRRWLFVEIEPEIAWPWTPERGRHSAWGLALRVELQFQGKGAPRPPPPAEPGEPDDPGEDEPAPPRPAG